MYVTLHGVSLFCGSITLCSLNFEVKTVAVISVLHILCVVAFRGNCLVGTVILQTPQNVWS
jgi:hypothetical protein